VGPAFETLENRCLMSITVPMYAPLALPVRPAPVIGAPAVAPSVLSTIGGSVVIHPVVGQPFSGTVGTLTTPIHLTMLGTLYQVKTIIIWGDGTASAGTIVANQSGGYNIVGTHTYRVSGSFNIHIAVAIGPTTQPGVFPRPLLPDRLIAVIDSTADVTPT